MNTAAIVEEAEDVETVEVHRGIYDQDADETLARVNAVLAFLQDVVVRPNPNMEGRSPEESYGTFLVFEEVRLALDQTKEDLIDDVHKAALATESTG